MHRCFFLHTAVRSVNAGSGYGTGESFSVNRDFLYDPSLWSIARVLIDMVFFL